MARGVRYIGLLRGVNIGSSNRVPMAELRDAMGAAGYRDVATYLQSGNVVWTGARSERDRASGALSSLVSAAFGVDVPVVVTDGAELAAIAAVNPFLAGGADPGGLHLTLLDSAPDPGVADALAPPETADRFALDGRAVYLHCTDGYGRTPLTNAWFERRCATVATTRNWRTVVALLDLAGG